MTFAQQERIKDLGTDYGFERSNIGAASYKGFDLSRGGKYIYSVVQYREYDNYAEAYIKCNFNSTTVNKKELTMIKEMTEGTIALIDAFEKVNQSSRARISSAGEWRSRIS